MKFNQVINQLNDRRWIVQSSIGLQQVVPPSYSSNSVRGWTNFQRQHELSILALDVDNFPPAVVALVLEVQVLHKREGMYESKVDRNKFMHYFVYDLYMKRVTNLPRNRSRYLLVALEYVCGCVPVLHLYQHWAWKTLQSPGNPEQFACS